MPAPLPHTETRPLAHAPYGPFCFSPPVCVWNPSSSSVPWVNFVCVYNLPACRPRQQAAGSRHQAARSRPQAAGRRPHAAGSRQRARGAGVKMRPRRGKRTCRTPSRPRRRRRRRFRRCHRHRRRRTAAGGQRGGAPRARGGGPAGGQCRERGAGGIGAPGHPAARGRRRARADELGRAVTGTLRCYLRSFIRCVWTYLAVTVLNH